MDIINAINTGTKIISRDIGFFYDFKTAEDFCYDTYDQLRDFFLKLQESKLAKLNQAKINTWQIFREWHVKLFKEIYGRRKQT